MNLVIKNTRPTLITLPAVMPTLDADGELVDEGFVGMPLLPGENDVPEAYWAKVVKNPSIRIWVACEYLVNKGEGRASTMLASLDKLQGDVAKRHIGNCTNMQVLSDWNANTESRVLRKLIEERKLELIAKADGSVAGEVHGDAGVDASEADSPVFGAEGSE